MALSFGEYAESAKGFNRQNAAPLVKKKRITEIFAFLIKCKFIILKEIVFNQSWDNLKIKGAPLTINQPIYFASSKSYVKTKQELTFAATASARPLSSETRRQQTLHSFHCTP